MTDTNWFRDPARRMGCYGSDTTEPTREALGAGPAALPHALDRRGFLRLVGFSVAAAGATSACSRGPVQTALAYLDPPRDIVPGRLYQIASTTWADGSGSGLLVTCRDGRPIKLEGNPGQPVNRGGLTASAQASLLSLYDEQRFDGPRLDDEPTSWSQLDDTLRGQLAALRAARGTLRVLTSTITSPSTLHWIERLLGMVQGSRHVSYDVLSASALLDATAATRGRRVLPRYDLSRAQVLASFDADFLGTWISPAGFSADYASARRPDDSPPRMSRHWQLEARLSLSGSRADQRVRLAPWETTAALAFLGGALAAHAGATPPGPVPESAGFSESTAAALTELAGELWAQRGASLVICGRNDLDAQLLVAWINDLLDADGATQDLSRPSLQRRGDDAALAALRDELLADQVDLLIVANANPAYDVPGFAEALTHAGTLVCTSPLPDETSALAHVVCPEPHELERWDDSEPLAGVFTTTQPTLPALRDARTLRASLAAWTGEPRDDRELLADHWRNTLAGRREDRAQPFDAWFASVLERGWVELPSEHEATPSALQPAPVADALRRAAIAAPAPADGALGLVLYPKVGLLDGRGAHNPWLQELPDPVTKVTWDNHADLSPATAERLGIATGDVVSVRTEDGTTLQLPAFVQPGQDDRVLAVALGYGRLGTDRFTNVGPEWLEAETTVEPGGTVGADANPLAMLDGGVLRHDGRAVTVTATGARHELAVTQDHHSLTVPPHLAPKRGKVRDAVRLIAFSDLVADPEGALSQGHAGGHRAAVPGELWADDHENDRPQWGLAIDLAACTGCSACVVSCQAENNVPVVGRDEVRRHREMSWLRIDRYYNEHEDGDVDVVHQPMMCQHCGHAPCETVCPVLATMRSSEGLNQQIYNRCVGTRYCANNCPYKVRRFNWFEYAQSGRLQNLALNPDVTIRSRGVMEKCSLCVQRIQAAKAEAARKGAPLADGDIQTACQQSCPSQAILFGDRNDEQSELSVWLASHRGYDVLEELNVQPGVRYLADVRNVDSKGGPGHG